VHSALTTVPPFADQSVVETEMSTANWSTSQAAATHATRGRIQHIRGQGYHVSQRARARMFRYADIALMTPIDI
jgi:hypothetical protein